MRRISVLQLDTNFPRIAGDVGCAETFQCDLEIIRVPNATVDKIVTASPNQIDLTPFLNALSLATGDLITTSCGFLAPFQSELAAHCSVPFIASALGQLDHLRLQYTSEELRIITFDPTKLTRAHLPDGCDTYEASIWGLNKASHLTDVIANDRPYLDRDRAVTDMREAFRVSGAEAAKAVLLECTNLPPYKKDLRKIISVPIYDILTAIEVLLPNAVHPQFL